MAAKIVETLVTVWLACVAPQHVDAVADWRPGSPADRAFQFFASFLAPHVDVNAALEVLRPFPIGVHEKQRVLLELPPEGELRPNHEEEAKLTSLQRVLIYHHRYQVFDLKVVDIPHAGVALYARAVLLFSRPALRLLSAAELEALVAHEAGHEYFWSEYEAVRRRGDARARQELELRCDGIAVLTLLELGLDPAAVSSATAKLTRFNERFGANPNDELYPTTDERAQFVRALARARAGVGSRL